MKKKICILTTCFLLLLIGILVYFCYSQNIELAKLKKNMQIEAETYPEIYDVINSVSYNNLESFLEENNDSETIIYIGRSTCSDCTIFEPDFIEFINEYSLNKQIIYLSVTQIRNDDSKWEAFKIKYDLKYTPTVAIFKNGKVVTKVEWTPENGISINAVKEWFETNNLMER